MQLYPRHGEKRMILYKFICFHWMQGCDGQTDGHTDRHAAHRRAYGAMCIPVPCRASKTLVLHTQLSCISPF